MPSSSKIVRCKLVRVQKHCGNKSSVYSVYLSEERKTVYEKFQLENLPTFKSEIVDIVKRIHVIGKKTGAQESFFKLKEGKPGDGVCALYDRPDSKLRLYCIRFGSVLLIVGGGGEKPKGMRALQESEKLTEENYLLRELSAEISRRQKDGDIKITANGMDLEGDLEFELEIEY